VTESATAIDSYYPETKLQLPENIRELFRPRETYSIGSWTERFRHLGRHSEDFGPMRIDRILSISPVMEFIESPGVVEVILMKSAQIGGTETMFSIMGYYAHQEPCPILLVMADQSTAEYMGRERLQSMFIDSPELSVLLGDIRTKTEMSLLNGAYIALAWASSVAGLGSRSFRVVIMDEIDKPGYKGTSSEAAPVSLARERTETFFRRKHLLLSTPTLESGNICSEMSSCDIVYDFHIPCPHCGLFQPMRWSTKYMWGFDQEGWFRGQDGKHYRMGHVSWKNGRNASAKDIAKAGYKCGECNKLWTTLQKNRAVEKGVPVERKAINFNPRKVGYHVNRLYSLLGQSGDIPEMVRGFLKVLQSGDPKLIQGFVNSALAEPWREFVIKVADDSIERAKIPIPKQTIPEDVIALTCGVDVQRMGFWYVVRGWARDYKSYLIDYGLIQTWDELENLLFNTRYPVKDREGQVMSIFRMCIDTGGGTYGDAEISMTEETYYWIRQNQGRGAFIWGSKGSSRPMMTKIRFNKPLDKTPTGRPIPGGLQLALVDSGALKDLYFFRLDQAINNGPTMPAFLNQDVDDDYIEQITAEEKRLEKGLQVWVQIRRDNHLLDAECLAMAVADPEWIGGGIHLVPDQKKSMNEKKRRPAQATGNRWLGQNRGWRQSQ
jgi:phage terminase large subunit GpA-like protein